MSRQVIIKCGDAILDSWVTNMRALLPDEFDVVPYSSSDVDPPAVAYIIGWRPDARWVNEFPNVRALISIGSGVDHIANLPDLRGDVPVIRTVSPDLVQRMREYVAMCVLAWHRQLLPILAANRDHRWDRFAVDVAGSIRVGILGYGSMGSAAASALASLGYHVSVWAASPRDDQSFDYYHGPDQLLAFAGQCDVAICLLPLTPETTNILDYRFMSAMRHGGCLINAARGGHVVDGDLIRAAQEGTISFAFLDGLRDEPLGPTSPLWDVPNIIVTCHSASYISPDAGPRIIAANLLKFDAGERVEPMYDPRRGY